MDFSDYMAYVESGRCESDYWKKELKNEKKILLNNGEEKEGKMKVQDRKEKAFIHKALIDILTDCPNDMTYLKRLIFAQEVITNAIEEFTNEEYMNVIMELKRG